jgi:hypothetical protein
MANENSHDGGISPASTESIREMMSSTDDGVIRKLIDNPLLDETHMCLLLERKDLSAALLDEIAKRKIWRERHRVRRALVGHPHTPRLVAKRLLREMHLSDLLRIALMHSSPMELKRLAEDRIVDQMPQLALGQRLMLARRGPARIAGELVARGPGQAARIALDNPLINESQLLKALTVTSAAEQTIAMIARHPKWSNLSNVRRALLQHPNVPLECLRDFARDLSRHELEVLHENPTLQEGVRAVLSLELARRES